MPDTLQICDTHAFIFESRRKVVCQVKLGAGATARQGALVVSLKQLAGLASSYFRYQAWHAVENKCKLDYSNPHFARNILN